MSDPEKTPSSTMRCERDHLLAWLREVLSASDGIDVQIVVEEAADARSSVQITLHDIPRALDSIELRRV